MLLKNLKLKNFRQYKGEQELQFSFDTTNNVTVILGENTSGKTTLIQAFNWVLYGNAHFDTKDFLLNLEIANQLNPGESEFVKVVVELIHDDMNYIISREQKYECISYGEVRPTQSKIHIQYKSPDGQTGFIQEKESVDTINKILPEDLSSYFFFDGERIGNLARNDRTGRQDIAQAVKGVLGLNVLDNAINHLSGGYKNSVIGKFKNSIDVVGNEKLIQQKTDLNNKRDRLEDRRKSLEDIKKMIDYYTSEKGKLEQILKENKETANLQQKIEVNEAEIRKLERKIAETRKKLINEFSSKAPFYFMQPLVKKAAQLLSNTKEFDYGIPYMHSESIDFLIKRGRCVCGTGIAEGNEAYNCLIEQKNYLPPQSIGTLVRFFINDAKHYQDISNESYESIEERYIDIREYINKVSELNSENESISKEIKGKVDVGQIEQQVLQFKQKIEDAEEEKESLIKEICSLETECDHIDNQIKDLAFTSEKNQHIKLCLEYADLITNTLKNFYATKEKEIRAKLEEKVNDFFTKMYHGQRKIVVNEKYQYAVETPNLAKEFQTKADKSTGLETITSFAFISGIVDLAREKITSEELDIKSEPYPLVMDAPFSNADEKHVTNVSRILPEVAEQVIMFIMHKDWQHASKVLDARLDKKYELKKITETNTEIKECS